MKLLVRRLEEVLILTAADFGVVAARSDVPARWSSVWVGNDKLAAIGVHLSDWVTTHGVALNVTTRLERFDLFVPCGIPDGGVTSLEKANPGRTPPSVADVARRFVVHFASVFDREPVERPSPPPRTPRPADRVPLYFPPSQRGSPCASEFPARSSASTRAPSG